MNRFRVVGVQTLVQHSCLANQCRRTSVFPAACVLSRSFVAFVDVPFRTCRVVAALQIPRQTNALCNVDNHSSQREIVAIIYSRTCIQLCG